MLQISTQFRNRGFYINSYWDILLIKIGKDALLKHFPIKAASIIASTPVTVEPGTPPYGHLGNTVNSLLRPLFLAASQKSPYIFL